ncbi:MAG: hypothetical protein EPN82_06255 [Bacteroidetes bacterium]|nr:MAG: hypothetical protein EPN82_06255 [Bacteroidota bacterium]
MLSFSRETAIIVASSNGTSGGGGGGGSGGGGGGNGGGLGGMIFLGAYFIPIEPLNVLIDHLSTFATFVIPKA